MIMKAIEYISYISIPIMILVIMFSAWKQKKDAYELFLEGATEGFKVIIRIFPTMLGIFVAINLFKVTGAMNILINLISPITNVLGIPVEIVPLGIMSSISGGASIGILSETLETYGVDSLIGNIASTILGSSETTLYVIAIYTSSVAIKNTRGILKISLFCDLMTICRVYLNHFFICVYVCILGFKRI